jgi:hypothetical protein
VKQTYETTARLVDDTLVYLACADCGLRAGEVAHFTGYAPGVTWLLDAIERRDLTVADLGKEKYLPRRPCHLVFGGDEGYLLILQTARRVGLVEAQRLKAMRVVPPGSERLCVVEERHIPNSGTPRTEKTYYSSGGGKWHPLQSKSYSTTRRVYRPDGRGGYVELDERMSTHEADSAVRFACASAWAEENEWAVRFGLPGAPRLALVADPVACRDLLRLRDKPEGRDRRAALLHWVRRHWRRGRRDPEAEHQVRAHLRGADTCSWFGLDCQIVPSKPDADNARRPELRPRTPE